MEHTAAERHGTDREGHTSKRQEGKEKQRMGTVTEANGTERTGHERKGEEMTGKEHKGE